MHCRICATHIGETNLLENTPNFPDKKNDGLAANYLQLRTNLVEVMFQGQCCSFDFEYPRRQAFVISTQRTAELVNMTSFHAGTTVIITKGLLIH